MGIRDDIDESSPTAAPAQRRTADYVARMAADLRLLSTCAELGFLAYLLGMAEEEASRLSKSGETGSR